jgi:hypothetical protein
MIALVPLLIVPFILFNVLIAGMAGPNSVDPLGAILFSMNMISGGVWQMSYGHALLALGLVMLFFEILKSTAASRVSVVDHMLSTGVFILFLVEFLLVARAAHPVFFLLMLMALIDLIAGFSVSIRSAGRDVSIN